MLRRAVWAGLVFLLASLVSGCGHSKSAVHAPPPVRVKVTPGESGGVNLTRLVRASAERALRLLPSRGQVRIDIRPNPDGAIPEIGVGGHTDLRGTVHLSWDPTRVAVRRDLLAWIPLIVAHELHHSSRFRAGAGGNTLGDVIVSEGLADRFAHEVYPRAQHSPWDHALTKEQEHAYWKRVRPLLQARIEPSVFWGDNGRFPEWAGYTVGYDIVGRYLTAHHVRAAALVTVKAKTILADVGSPA
jgi:hypothetical protein